MRSPDVGRELFRHVRRVVAGGGRSGPWGCGGVSSGRGGTRSPLPPTVVKNPPLHPYRRAHGACDFVLNFKFVVLLKFCRPQGRIICVLNTRAMLPPPLRIKFHKCTNLRVRISLSEEARSGA